jgi:uncharacterized membrane protein YfcA
LLLSFSFIVVFIISLLKGAKDKPSIVGIKTCSKLYWIISPIQYPVLFVLAGAVAFYLHRQYNRKLALNYKFEEGEIKWNKLHSVLIPSLFLIAGIIAGCLGLGGGIVAGPLLLELGMLPQVAVATSSFMVFLTAASTVAQFAVLGLLPWDYSLWYCFFGILSGLVGQYVIGSIVQKYNKFSWIVFMIAIVIGLSACLMSGVGIYNIVQDIAIGRSMGFRSFCN